MEQHLDPLDRCAAMVAILNKEQGWNLSPEEQQRYSSALLHYLPDPCSDLQLRQLAIYYDLDHRQVEALRNGRHTEHEAAWTSWMSQVVRILRHAGLDQTNDASIDLDDLAQIARADLARALPSFRYASRLSTWAHQVVIHSARRVIRDSQAGKRAGRPDPLEQSAAFLVPILEGDHPENAAAAQVLSHLIQDILATHPDRRFATIFQLWAEQDLAVIEVGKRVNLGPARVRVLIQQICQLLQQHPAIRDWLDDEGVY